MPPIPLVFGGQSVKRIVTMRFSVCKLLQTRYEAGLRAGHAELNDPWYAERWNHIQDWRLKSAFGMVDTDARRRRRM